MSFQPLVNYAGYEHVLNALPTFVHPTNGNLYGVAIEKQGGTRQNLSVYRVRPGSHTCELVKRWVGGIDSKAQIAAGGCVILQDGSLEVWASAVPVIIPPVTKTGFEGVWDRVPNVDEPWSGTSTPPAPAGSGGVVLLPSVATNAAWEGHVLTAGVLVDIPSVFGVPSASAYLVRFVAVAPAANVRARAGTQATPFFLTCNTQAPGVEMHEQGWIPGPQAWISPAQGTPTTWLQVIGYST